MRQRLGRLLRLMKIIGTQSCRDPETLSRDIGVSRRTLFRDLAALREGGVIVTSRTSDPRYSLARDAACLVNVLTLEEHSALLLFLADGVQPAPGSGFAVSLEAAKRKSIDALLDTSSDRAEVIRVVMAGFRNHGGSTARESPRGTVNRSGGVQGAGIVRQDDSRSDPRPSQQAS